MSAGQKSSDRENECLTSFPSTGETGIPLTLHLCIIFFQKHSDVAGIRSWYQDHKVKCIQYQENCCKRTDLKDVSQKKKNSFFLYTLFKYRMLFKRNLFQVQLTNNISDRLSGLNFYLFLFYSAIPQHYFILSLAD